MDNRPFKRSERIARPGAGFFGNETKRKNFTE